MKSSNKVVQEDSNNESEMDENIDDYIETDPDES